LRASTSSQYHRGNNEEVFKEHGHPIEIEAEDSLHAVCGMGITVWSREDYDRMMERLADSPFQPTGGWLEPIPHPKGF